MLISMSSQRRRTYPESEIERNKDTNRVFSGYIYDKSGYYAYGSDRGAPKRLPSISSMPSCNRIGASEAILDWTGRSPVCRALRILAHPDTTCQLPHVSDDCNVEGWGAGRVRGSVPGNYLSQWETGTRAPLASMASFDLEYNGQGKAGLSDLAPVKLSSACGQSIVGLPCNGMASPETERRWM